ncbi:MAG TPA: hypothetical protein DCF33_04090 [Saprospirales bacterium]|nr:hypothetical protein [Saprospirales bacterium]
MKQVFRSKPNVTAVMILLMIVLGSSRAFTQSTLFSIISQPSTLDDAQAKVLNYASTAPHVGNLMFVQFSSLSTIGQNGGIDITIPGVNNGSPLTFEVQNAVFDDPQHFSILASGNGGYVTLYFTPEGIGGTIDLVNRLFVLTPFGEDMGLLTERNLMDGNSANCGNEAEQVVPRDVDFCEGDCGPATLDVLLLRTPEANNWLSTTWGIFTDWFLFVEGNNINLAFFNSDIPNKRVRITAINYTPEFAWSTNQFIDFKIEEDLNSITNSVTAQNLMATYGADVVVLLTNNNYTGPVFGLQGTFSIFGISNSLDPFSTNKFCITQVANIDPARFTLAHEVGHQFGCRHSSEADGTTCPFGKNMSNGRNTIMANNAGSNTRIPNFSNPDVLFGGIATGNVGTRNNAQQIRGAFCESANNNPDPQFSVFIEKTSIGPICLGETHTFSSTIIQGSCIEPFGLIPSVNCGVGPYQYEWRFSTNPNFTNSQIIGTSSNVTLTITTCTFYLRVTVTSSNGLTTTSTRMYKCGLPNTVCDRSEPNSWDGNKQLLTHFQAIPNPATSGINIVGPDVDHIEEIKCFNLLGSEISTSFFREEESGRIKIEGLNLSPGLYLFWVSGEGLNEVIKVVIQ